jgi:hypothetical protein
MTAPAVSMAQVLSTFGQPATVVRPFPDDTPIATTVMWLSQRVEQSSFAPARRIDGRRVLILAKSDVPTAPTNTKVAVAEPPVGTDVRHWIVESPAPTDDYGRGNAFEFDHHRVVMVPDPEMVTS